MKTDLQLIEEAAEKLRQLAEAANVILFMDPHKVNVTQLKPTACLDVFQRHDLDVFVRGEDERD